MPSVVVLEDDPTLLLMYRRLFERYFDCSVAEATDGPEGLRLIAATRPDLVVLDVHLPSMSGPDVLDALRSDPATADTACIVITSENQRPVIERLVAGNVLGIFLKPVVLSRDLPRLEKIFSQLASRGSRSPLARTT